MFIAKRGEAMTGEEAVKRYRCDECDSDGNCSHDCVLSATGSVICQSCDGQVYFANSRYPEAPYDCVYCGAHNKDYTWEDENGSI